MLPIKSAAILPEFGYGRFTAVVNSDREDSLETINWRERDTLWSRG